MTASRSTLNEVHTPSIPEDFDPGDRAYWRGPQSVTRFGTVKEVEADSIWLELTGVRGDVMEATVAGQHDDSIFNLGRWRKMPDDTLIQVGDVMSTSLPYYVSAPDRREYFTVIEIIPGRKISLRNHEDNDYVVNIKRSTSLDEYMQYWELEG
jgi:hypothetical protein